MRRLEYLLVAAAMAVSLLIWLGRSSLIAAAVLAAILAAHLLVDRPRWQFVPVYAVSLVAVVLAALNPPMPGWLGQVIFWPGAVLLAVGVIAGLGLPVRPPPPLTGPFPVGTTTMHLAGQDRPEIHSSVEGDTRQLMMQIWYPAAESDQPMADYLPDHEVGGRALTKAAEMPFFGLDHLRLIRPHARVEPDFVDAAEAFPVLLFSHGRSGTRVQNTYQVEELVSHGYVVAAVDHAYGAGYTVYPDGQLIEYDHSIWGNDTPEQAGLVTSEWVKDLGWVLDTLEQLNAERGGRFGGMLDLERVGSFGHSAGAGALIELAFRDERCGPVVGYDPWVVPVSDEAVEAGISQPLLIIKQEAELGPANAARLEGLFRWADESSSIVEVAGTKHLDFNDYTLLVPALRWIGLMGPIDGERLGDILNQFTRAFFDTHLRGRPVAPILEESPFDEARFRRR